MEPTPEDTSLLRASTSSMFNIGRYLAWGVHVAAIVNLSLIMTWLVGMEAFGGFSTDRNESKYFSHHPLYNMIAFGVCMATGLVTFKAWNLRHKVLKAIHATLNSIALIFALTAFGFAVHYKQGRLEHFATPHQLVGFSAYISLMIQASMTLFVLLTNKFRLTPTFMKIHRLFGFLTYLLGSTALCMGLEDGLNLVKSLNPSLGYDIRHIISANSLTVAITAVLVVLTNVSQHV